MAATVNGAEIEIDEDLFGGDDIDDVEDELETLDLVDDQSSVPFSRLNLKKIKLSRTAQNCCDCDKKKNGILHSSGFEILTEIMILGHETLGNSISILIKKQQIAFIYQIYVGKCLVIC